MYPPCDLENPSLTGNRSRAELLPRHRHGQAHCKSMITPTGLWPKIHEKPDACSMSRERHICTKPSRRAAWCLTAVRKLGPVRPPLLQPRFPVMPSYYLGRGEGLFVHTATVVSRRLQQRDIERFTGGGSRDEPTRP
jgi:hypothetical protein